MRRDVFISNDSGALSVIAADAIDAIIADGRSDDEALVKQFKALLLEQDARAELEIPKRGALHRR